MEQLQPISLIKKPKLKKEPKPFKISCNVANKPILSHHVEEQVHAAVAQYLAAGQWSEWGLKFLRKQGSLILLHGEPGTGKTTTASYLTQIIKRPLAHLNLSTFGSSEPGAGERNITNFFAQAASNNATVFLDEADSILWNRDKATGDSMWFVSIISTLLTNLSEYRDLCILATNREGALDSAIQSRVIAEIHIGRPDFNTRQRLWAAKIPKRYPLQLSQAQIEIISQYDLTGRMIESAIIKEAQQAIIQGRLPQFDSLCNVAISFQGK